MAQHTAAADRNVGLTFLRTFYQSLELSSILPIAQAELELQHSGKSDTFKALYASRGDNIPWEQDRDITTCTPLFAQCLAELLPQRYPTADLALKSIEVGLLYSEGQVGIDDAVTLLLRWLDEQQQAIRNQGALRLIFVADEVGAWAGRNLDRIEELRAFVEALGRLGQGRIWLLVTSQEKLSDVLVLQRDITSAVPATGQEVACDGSNRRRSCGAADRRSKPTPQADPARVGARRPARASAPERHSAAGRGASPGQAPHRVWARDRSLWGAGPPSLWFRRCCHRTRK